MTQNKSNNDEYLLESYRLFHLLRQTTDAVYKSRERELKNYKITPEQAGALVCIRSLGSKATPAELSRWLFRERNSMTILLNRMHAQGLINKNKDSKRKNSIKLSLTKRGDEAYQRSIEFKSFSSIIDALPPKKRAQLWTLLQAIRLKTLETLCIDPSDYSRIFTKSIIIDLNNSEIDGEN